MAYKLSKKAKAAKKKRDLAYAKTPDRLKTKKRDVQLRKNLAQRG